MYVKLTELGIHLILITNISICTEQLIINQSSHTKHLKYIQPYCIHKRIAQFISCMECNSSRIICYFF